MWSDNETSADFLNFSSVAETVSELIIQSAGRPISIGVSGAWGVGKSSMIKLIYKSLEERDKENEDQKFIFVEFNAWLYQGYDDARAALMEVIASKLEAEAEKRKKGIEKVKELIKRIDWFRTAKLATSVAAVFAGVPPMTLIGEVIEFGKRLGTGNIEEEEIKKTEAVIERIGAATKKGFFKQREDSSPPKEIHELRECFEKTLKEMDVTLVVLIDDLDRCLPETTISTLEAIRLFLFLQNTAFVIAADDDMIKHAVKRHFHGVDDEHVINYFDKLIQIPIRVPPLGTQEVRAYIILLFIENSDLKAETKELIRTRVCEQLGESWQGKRVDRAFIQSLEKNLPASLVAQLDTADRLAPMMTKATKIKGNPRLIKRFLNALAIRMTISRAHGIGIDEAALVKMLLFERCGDAKAYAELSSAVMSDTNGKPTFLHDWEENIHSGKELQLKAPWDNPNDPFIVEWLALPPRLADIDLRGVLYVSREHAPLISEEDQLSSEGAKLLTAMLERPEMAGILEERLKKLTRTETSVIMDRILEKARQEQEWGVPPILDACIVVSKVDPSQSSRIAAFLSERPASQIKPSIVPKISDYPWSKEIFMKWESADVSQPVKKAIKIQGK